MEVRTSVGALIPIHPDRDPVEGADPRHVGTIRSDRDEPLLRDSCGWSYSPGLLVTHASCGMSVTRTSGRAACRSSPVISVQSGASAVSGIQGSFVGRLPRAARNSP